MARFLLPGAWLRYTDRVKRIFFLSLLVLTVSSLLPGLGGQQQTETSAVAPRHTPGPKAEKKRPSSQQIAEAQAQGLVWVNTATRVYHKEGPLYGTTKLGKFMKEEDAQKAGYRLASSNASPNKKSSPHPS